MNWLKENVIPPHVALVLLVVGGVVQYWLGAPRIVPANWWPAGLIVIATGLALLVSTIRRFRHRDTTLDPSGKPTVFITDGPYRFTRNPIYLAFTLILLGIGLLAGSVPMLLVPVIFPIVIHLAFIPREERNLARAFGRSYRTYQSNVRRWL